MMDVSFCEDMCPAKERGERARERAFSIFEVEDGVRVADSRIKTLPRHLAVKQYLRRSASESMAALELARRSCGPNAPSAVSFPSVRSPAALERTVAHLLALVDDRQSVPAGGSATYAFISDRFRAVRQDVVVYEAIVSELERSRAASKLPPLRSQAARVRETTTAIRCLRQIARCLIHYGFLMQFQVQCDAFDAVLHAQQLSDTLTYLKVLCNTMDKTADKTVDKAAVETSGFLVMLMLCSPSGSIDMANAQRLLSSTLQYRCSRVAMQALWCASTGNYGGFVRLIRDSSDYFETVLLACALPRIRADAIPALNTAYRRGMPLAALKNMLLFRDDDHAIGFLRSHGVAVTDRKGSPHVDFGKRRSKPEPLDIKKAESLPVPESLVKAKCGGKTPKMSELCRIIKDV